MKFQIEMKGRFYDVEISDVQEGKVKIKVGDKEFIFEAPASVSSKQEKVSFARNYLNHKKDFKEREIKSPINGEISEIFVKPGEKIVKGQKVILLSAMKMANEIISEFPGKVKEIKVKNNQQVQEGETLIILT